MGLKMDASCVSAACNQQLSNYHDVIDDTTEVLEHEVRTFACLLRHCCLLL